MPADPAGALAEAEALLALQQQLAVLAMRRIGDVDRRKLFEQEGFRSVQTWLSARRPDGDNKDAWLGAALVGFPVLDAAVESGTVSMAAARKVVWVLRQARRTARSVDDLLPAVVGNVVPLVMRALGGLPDDDPQLERLVKACEAIEGRPRCSSRPPAPLLATEIPVGDLSGPLDELLLSLHPSLLEQRAAAGREAAGLSLGLRPDGRGWKVSGELDLECGERLFVALRSEAARDPMNPADTVLWLQNRDAGLEPWDDGAEVLRPRDKRRRLHDALDRLLTRYLDAGLGGTSGKVPVQVAVTIPEPEGSLPARADSGALIPRSMVRRWWCDSSVTAFVMSLGGRALRVVHGQRTLTGRERRALAIWRPAGGALLATAATGRATRWRTSSRTTPNGGPRTAARHSTRPCRCAGWTTARSTTARSCCSATAATPPRPASSTHRRPNRRSSTASRERSAPDPGRAGRDRRRRWGTPASTGTTAHRSCL